MSKKTVFIEMVSALLDLAKENEKEIDLKEFEEGISYFEAFKETKEKEKAQFTENGKLIINYMKENSEQANNMFKARDIADGIFVSSRSVSGSIRKLVTDGFVEKAGQDPIIYSLTPLGVEVVVE